MELVSIATLPVRVAVAAARQTLGLAALDRLAATINDLTAPDRPLGRMLERGGVLDRLLAEGGVLDQLISLGELAGRIPLARKRQVVS